MVLPATSTSPVKIPLEVWRIVRCIPETEFNIAEKIEFFFRIRIIGQCKKIDLTVVMNGNESKSFAFSCSLNFQRRYIRVRGGTGKNLTVSGPAAIRDSRRYLLLWYSNSARSDPSDCCYNGSASAGEAWHLYRMNSRRRYWISGWRSPEYQDNWSKQRCLRCGDDVFFVDIIKVTEFHMIAPFW